jgi:hypothetical protein
VPDQGVEASAGAQERDVALGDVDRGVPAAQLGEGGQALGTGSRPEAQVGQVRGHGATHRI